MQIPWIKRFDLQATVHDAGGWVVKDPLTLNYALLDDAEYAILNLLDGKTPFPKMLAVLRQRFPDRGVGPEDLADFIRHLAGHQLIRQTVAGDSLRLRSGSEADGPLRYLKPLFQILRLQVPLLNPTHILDNVLPHVQFAFRPQFWKAMAFVAFSALLIVVLRFSELQQALPTIQEFLGAPNIAIMLLVFVAVKVLHEAGHAFCARYFKAECNECGVMLLVMTPVLYTNVSDAWTLPKRERMLITFSGILVELSIAVACTILWWFCEPGVTRSLLLNTMLLCSLNTLLFNGNPLLRFDGYFLLTDWLGIPNLSSRAAAFVQSWFVRLMTGRRQALMESEHRRTTLLIYGLLALAYRMLLTFAILKLVQEVSKQWHVEFVGSILSLTLLTGSVAIPLGRFAMMLKAELATSDEPQMRVRFRTAIFAALGAIALLWPLPQSVVVPAYVQSKAPPVFAELSGRIRPVATYGQQVQIGDVLAVLENFELQKNLQRLQGRSDELTSQLESLRRNPITAGSESLPAIQEASNAAMLRVADFERQMEKLTIRSKHNGIFLPPIETAHQHHPDLPQLWFGSAMAPENSGAWIERGTMLGHVGVNSDVELVACVGEDNVEYIRKSQTAEFSPRISGPVMTAEIREVGQLEADMLPLALNAAGLISGRPTEVGISPLSPTYFVTAELTNTKQQPLLLYSVGHLRISTQRVSLIARFVRYLRQTF